MSPVMIKVEGMPLFTSKEETVVSKQFGKQFSNKRARS